MSDRINNTILAPSAVRLFGRLLIGAPAALAAAKEPAERRPAGEAEVVGGLGASPLGTGSLPRSVGRSLLFQALEGNDLSVAHVYAFSYEGRYTSFRVPALFLVHGPGDPVHDGTSHYVDPARLGLAHLDGTITFAQDLRLWIYDRADFTIRLDMNSGAIQTLVIDAETGGHGRRVDLVGQDSSFSGRLGQGSY